MYWTYEKYDEETGEVKHCPERDNEGEITGKIIIGLKAYFDENPEERIALGWIKHIHYENADPYTGRPKDPQFPEYDYQTQYLTRHIQWIDEYTCEDLYTPIDKSEEMLRLEELMSYRGDGFLFS